MKKNGLVVESIRLPSSAVRLVRFKQYLKKKEK